MKETRGFLVCLLAFFLAVSNIACGGAEPVVDTADDEDYDPIAALVGDVEVEEEDKEEDESVEENYTGPTKLIINLKVVNEKNPEGSYRLLDSSGAEIIKNGKFGEEIEVNQGTYSVEFETPLVFGKPKYLVENVEVADKKMTLDEIFPAGQITLNTYRGKNVNRCIATSFSVVSKTKSKDIPGKGKTCKPLILETGHYEIQLVLSKKNYQPVEMRINREQVQTSNIKLEK